MTLIPALFDEGSDEQQRQFRLLLFLLPWPYRNIIEVFLMTSQRLALENANFPEDYCEFVEEIIHDMLERLHKALPKYPGRDMAALFHIPHEAEMILRNSVFFSYFSDESLSSEELLTRCNNYLDTPILTMSHELSSPGPAGNSQSSEPRSSARLTPQQLRILQHMAVLTLYRTPLRHKLNLKDMLELIDDRRRDLWGGVTRKFRRGKSEPAWRNGEHILHSLYLFFILMVQ